MRRIFFMLAVLGLLGSAGAATAAEMPVPGNLPAFLQNLNVAGGISAGEFYLAHSGPDAADHKLLLSNLLLEISSSDEESPIGFTAAGGETATPSLLGAPETNGDLDVEYAFLTLRPHPGTSFEAGLLQPDSGFEATYTYDNLNVMLGAVASQQPYNAYGLRARQELGPLELSAAYFNQRLDDGEYAVNDGDAPDRAWEVTLGGDLVDWDYSFYHYHLAGQRSLTGALFEHESDRLLVALDLDYWRWAGGMAAQVGRRFAVGGALYVAPRFGQVILPLRLEYIDQGDSGIYLEGGGAKIVAATLSPTYLLTEKAYLRADIAYIHARDGFADQDGTLRDGRLALAAEVGYHF